MAGFKPRIYSPDDPMGECASCEDHELLFECGDGRARCESCAKEVAGDITGALRALKINQQNKQASLRADGGPIHRKRAA